MGERQPSTFRRPLQSASPEAESLERVLALHPHPLAHRLRGHPFHWRDDCEANAFDCGLCGLWISVPRPWEAGGYSLEATGLAVVMKRHTTHKHKHKRKGRSPPCRLLLPRTIMQSSPLTPLVPHPPPLPTGTPRVCTRSPTPCPCRLPVNKPAPRPRLSHTNLQIHPF